MNDAFGELFGRWLIAYRDGSTRSQRCKVLKISFSNLRLHQILRRMGRGSGRWQLPPLHITNYQKTARETIIGHEETVRVFKEALDQRERTIDEAKPPKIAKATDIDGGHGRIETRTAYVIEDFDDWVPSSSQWRGIKSLIAVEAKREDTISGKLETECRYYISSRKLTAKQANKAVRSHWLVHGYRVVAHLGSFSSKPRHRRDDSARFRVGPSAVVPVAVPRARSDRKMALAAGGTYVSVEFPTV